jgi:hypothetical protein
MYKSLSRALVTLALSALLLPCGQAFAETRIDAVFLDTDEARLLIDGHEFKKDFVASTTKVYVSLGGRRLSVDLAATTDTHIEASYADAFEDGLPNGGYQVFVSRVDASTANPLNAHSVPRSQQAKYSLTVKPPRMVFRGAWSIGRAYVQNNIVTLEGSTYIALLSSMGQRPDVATGAWAVLARRGPAGPTGEPGPSDDSGDILKYPYETVYGDVCLNSEPTPGCTFSRATGERITVSYDPDYDQFGYGSDDLWYVRFDSAGNAAVYDDLGVFQYIADANDFAGYVGGTTIGVGTTGYFWENVSNGTYWFGDNGILYSANTGASNYGQAIN